jgi:hypothetical protein
MGALDFVSQDANLVAAFVVSEPGQLVQDLFDYLEQSNPQGWQELVEFENSHGISLVEGLAAPLGGEFVFALDGPILPTPSWKIVIEVYDQSTLQATLAQAISKFNEQAALAGQTIVVSLQQQPNSDRSILYSLQFGESQSPIYYMYLSGYMVIAPDPTLIAQSADYRGIEYTLTNSPDFMSLVPQGESVNMSAFFYHNLAPLLRPILSGPLAETLAQMTPDGQESIASFLGNTPPILVSMNNEPGRVSLVSNGDLESLWMNLGTLSSVGGPEGIAKMISQPPLQ